jgi:adenosylcobinamide-GDP ribazoletransferase
MLDELRYLLLAVQFFTRIPVPAWVQRDFRPEQLAGSARYFPVVGWLVGIAGALAYLGASAVLPPLAGALAGIAATAWLTGAFHEDGLADTADALGGQRSRAQALAIMKDSRIGTYGALALLLTVAAKAALLADLDIDTGVVAMVAAHALSRALPVALIALLPYARDDAEGGTAKPLAERVSGFTVLVALLFGLAPWIAVVWIDGPALEWLLAPLASALAWLGCWHWFRRRLGGFTGDTLGACQQLTELAFYLGLSLQFAGAA